MKQSLVLIALITIIAALILIFSFRAAHPYSFEGEMDPNVFCEWPRIAQGMMTPVIGQIIVQNPDPAHPIQKIQLIIHVPKDLLVIYQYFKHGEIFRYELDCAEDRYKRAYFDEVQRKRCMACHQDKIRGGIKHGI